MKKDYMVSSLKPFKKAEAEVTEVLDSKIRQALARVQESPQSSQLHIEQLYDLLLKQKKVCAIKEELKKQIFRYFLEREIKEMNFIRLRDKHTLKILRICKTKLKDLQLDWKDTIRRFQQSTQQTQKVVGLYEFLTILRPYYSCNNLLQVFEWFKGKYNLASEITWFYIEKFINITPQTDRRLIEQFMVQLLEYFEMGGQKDMHTWRWLFRIKKKAPDLPMTRQLEMLNNQMLKKFLQIQNKGGKGLGDILSPKFLGSSFANLVGRKNPMSVNLIQMFFEIYKNSFVAFMQSKQNVKFLAVFLTDIRDRKVQEDKLRKKIAKIEESKEEEQESEEQEESEPEEDMDENMSNLVGNFVVIEESDSEEEEQQPEKPDKEARLKKLRLKLSNQLTEEILEALRYNIDLYMEDIFFVQSKEACKALGAAFNLFPKLAEASVELIRKGVDIPQLNVPILMKMTKKALQSLLVHTDRTKLLGYVLDILECIGKIRYIKDGWNTISLLIGNIPLLDEQDCAQLNDSHKEFFEKHYGMKHDQFYERYSQLVFEAYKRFLNENEAKQKKRLLLQNPFNNLAINCYKFFEKRCITHAVQLYLQNHSLYIHYYLELKAIPPTLVEPFLHKTLPSYKSQHLDKKLLELVLASRSVSFEELRNLIENISRSDIGLSDMHETVRGMLQMWVHENAYFHSSYRAVKSSLEHLLSHHPERGQYHLTNHHRQKIDDSLKQVMTMWHDYYNYISKFIDDMGGEAPSITSNPIETITRMYFQNFDIDFTARKELIWRVRILKVIVEMFPYHRSLFSGNHLLKDVKFEQFSQLNDMVPQSVKLLERLLNVVLSKFPHDHKLVSALKSFAVGLVSCEESEFVLYSMDLKDVKKMIRKNEQEGLTNYYLLNMQIDLRINLLNQAISFGRDRQTTEPLYQYILPLIFHPDESGIPLRDPELTPKLTVLLFELLRTKIPENAEQNKKKKFQIKLADVLNDHIGQAKTQVTGNELVDFISICIELIGSAERTVREAYLSALKALLVKIEHIKVDAVLLEDRVLEGAKSGNPKQKLIWSICLLAASHSGKLVDYSKFAGIFNEMLFEDDFLMRKAAIFLNGFVTRTKRIASRKATYLKELPPYAKKSLEEFEDSGFLRPQHVNKRLSRRKWLRKYRGYNECEIVQKTHFPEIFGFLDDPEKCLRLLKTYHTDQISSEDEVAFTTKKMSIIKQITQLSDILGWIIKKYSKSVKLSKHQLGIYERVYGERFFKYLFEVDADTGYRFFKATKDFVKRCLSHIETLDNQVVVSNYITMLLNAYAQVCRQTRNEQLEEFCHQALRELMEKSSGQFWTLFCKLALNSLEEIDFLTQFFESFQPTSPSYYRAVERLLLIHGNRYNKIFGLLKKTFEAEQGLANPIVLKNIKALITFPDKHFFDRAEVDHWGLLDTQGLLSSSALEAVSEHLVTRTNKDFQEWLLAKLQYLVASEHIDLRKVGGNLLFECINAVAQLFMSKNNMSLLTGLLGVAVAWMNNNREEIKTQQGHFQGSLSCILSQIYTPEQFKRLIEHLTRLLVPQPQTIHYLSTFYKNPYNFIKQQQPDYQMLILKLLELLDNPLLYKQVLVCISGLLYYRKIGKDSLNQPFVLKHSHSETEREQRHRILESIKAFTSNERYRSVLLMALLLADVHNLRLYDQELQYILGGQKEKDKVKLWAKMMVESRGKAELIQDEPTKALWNKIKSFSNPYFYHA